MLSADFKGFNGGKMIFSCLLSALLISSALTGAMAADQKSGQNAADLGLGSFGLGGPSPVETIVSEVAKAPEFSVVEHTEIHGKFVVDTILSLPFGKEEGKVGFANGPDHTPFPESAQSFKITPEGILLTDTFNNRFMIIDGKGKVVKSITPKVDVEYTFYSAVERLSPTSFAATDTMNMCMLMFDQDGNVTGPAVQPVNIDDASALFLTRDAVVYMTDKGRSVKTVQVMNKSLELIASVPVSGLTEQGMAPVPAGGFAALSWGETEEVATLQFWNRDSKSEEVSFVKVSQREIPDPGFPYGRFKIAGIDARGRVYLHWSGLKCHLNDTWKKQLGELASKCPEMQPVTLFKVLERDGKYSDAFAVPSSTAPENAIVSENGTVYVLAYDADAAPAGSMKILRIQRK